MGPRGKLDLAGDRAFLCCLANKLAIPGHEGIALLSFICNSSSQITALFSIIPSV